MIDEFLGRREADGVTSYEAVQALKYVDGLGHAAPMLLGYHPVGRTNPFQDLLYSRLWDEGIAVLPVHRPQDPEELVPLARAGHDVVLHLHWLSDVLAGISSTGEARRARAGFTARLDRLVDAGIRLVWTVHNVLPHGAALPEEEAAVRQAVVDRCALVHVMASDTVAQCAPYFTIPAEKVLHVPHPAYDGAYPDAVPRHRARYELGLAADERVFALTGSIQPYKGLTTLLDAFDGVPADVPHRLIVAGNPVDSAEVADALARATLDPRVVLHARKLPVTDLPLYLRAADVAVLPYAASLNSGMLLLALGFGLPVVCPATGAYADVVRPEFARTFTTGDVDSLRSALVAAGELGTPEARAAALARAGDFAAATISAGFARALRERLPARR